jgi:hypothetical protein
MGWERPRLDPAINGIPDDTEMGADALYRGPRLNKLGLAGW